jgi:hypothetical protein
MALTALMVPSPLSLSVALPIGSDICHHHFVERLTAVAHFFALWAFPRSSQYFHRFPSMIRLSVHLRVLAKRRSRSRQIFGRILRQNFAVQ